MDFLFCPQTAHLLSSGFTSRWVSYFIFYRTNRNQSETLPYSHCRICQFTYISPQTSAFPPVTMDKVFLLPSQANISLLPSQGCHPWSYAFSLTLWTTSKPYALPKGLSKEQPLSPTPYPWARSGTSRERERHQGSCECAFNFQPSVAFLLHSSPDPVLRFVKVMPQSLFLSFPQTDKLLSLLLHLSQI